MLRTLLFLVAWTVLASTASAQDPPEPATEETQGIIATTLQGISDLLGGLLDTIKCAIISAVCWLMSLLLTAGLSVVEWLLLNMGTLAVPAVVLLAEWLPALNAWLPISEGATLLAGYWTFLLLYIPVRWMVRLLPGVGG